MPCNYIDDIPMQIFWGESEEALAPVSLNRTTLSPSQYWPYLEWLYTPGRDSRNEFEQKIKTRYLNCFTLRSNLGLTNTQFIAGGRYKQVFRLHGTQSNTVIKLYCELRKQQSERRIYLEAIDLGLKDFCVPEKFYVGYCTAPWVKTFDKDSSIIQARDQGLLKNSRLLELVMNDEKLVVDYVNYGIYKKTLRLLDLGELHKLV